MTRGVGGGQPVYVEGIPLRLADEGAGRGPVRIVAAPATVALHRRRAGQVALSVGKLGGARAAPSAPPSPAGPTPSSGGLKRPRRATPRDRQPRIDVGGAPEHHAGGRVGAGRGRPRGSMNRAPPRGSAGVDLRTKALRELEPGGAGVLGGAFVGRSGEVEGGAGEVEGGAGDAEESGGASEEVEDWAARAASVSAALAAFSNFSHPICEQRRTEPAPPPPPLHAASQSHHATAGEGEGEGEGDSFPWVFAVGPGLPPAAAAAAGNSTGAAAGRGGQEAEQQQRKLGWTCVPAPRPTPARVARGVTGAEAGRFGAQVCGARAPDAEACGGGAAGVARVDPLRAARVVAALLVLLLVPRPARHPSTLHPPRPQGPPRPAPAPRAPPPPPPPRARGLSGDARWRGFG